MRRQRISTMVLMALQVLVLSRLSHHCGSKMVVNAWTHRFSVLSSFRDKMRSPHGKLAISASSSSTTAATTAMTTTTTPLQAVVDLSHTEWTTTTTAPTHPPVVFLHGLLGNKRNFASLARSLAGQLQTPRRIFGLDLRNHGDSVVGEQQHEQQQQVDMSYDRMAADVVAFLDKLQLRQVVLIGHSMGGKIAQAVALRYPDRVHGLVVLDMAPVTYDEEADSTWSTVCSIVRRLDEVTRDAEVQTKRQVDLALREDIPDPALRAFCLTNWHDDTGRWKIPMDVITQQLPTLAAFEVHSPPPPDDDNNKDDDDQTSLSYTGDAFFIHGGQSRFVRHAHLPAIRRYFPNHMLTTIRGSGHWVHAEAPEDTLSLLLQFLDR